MEENRLQLLVYGFAVVLVMIPLLLWLRQGGKRSQAMEQLALGMGLQYEVAKPYLADELQRSGLDLFRRGRSKAVCNLLHGSYRDATMMTFDYRYVTGSGRHKRAHWQTVLLFSWKQIKLPEFKLRPRGFVDTLVGLVIPRGIDFKDYPAFFRNYCLVGWSETAVIRVFWDIVAEFCQDRPRLVLESSGNWLLVRRPHKWIKVGDMQEFVEEAQHVCELLCAVS
jgi:hypothetical protein